MPALAVDILRPEQLAALTDLFAILCLLVPLLQRGTASGEDVPRPFQRRCALFIAFLQQPSLLVLTDSGDDVLVEVLDDVKVVEDDHDVRTLLGKSLRKVRVHVAGDALNAGEPLRADVLHEVIHDLLVLALGDPEDMTGFEVHDVRGKHPWRMQFELVYAEVLCLFLRLYELLTANGVLLLKPHLVDDLDRVLPESGYLSDQLVCAGAGSQEVLGILVKRRRNEVPLSLERNVQHPRRPAFPALKLTVTSRFRTFREALLKV